MCIFALEVLAGCQNYYGETDARKDMINYLNNKYSKEFDVVITQTHSCSGGIGICDFEGEAYIVSNQESKCSIILNHSDYTDDCEKIVNEQ